VIGKAVGPEADEIRSHGLGWNLTDFASKDFENVGLPLIHRAQRKILP